MSGTSGSCPAQQQQQQQVRILPEIPPTTSHGTLNVASFNTLSNWWYVFKYYHPSVPMAERLWQCRGQRMREYVLGLQADVICLQEVRPDTFEQDFQFLREAAYEMRMEKSNNIYMRCAIAWRSDKLRLVEEHKKTQRALIVTLETIVGPSAAPPADDDGGHSGLKLESGACAFQQQRRQVVVATCHLSAGAKPDERTRQLEGILKTVEKRYGAGKVGGKGGAAKRQVDHIPLILCGDFNSEPDEAARHFLLNREIGPDFVDRVYPEVRVTKKVKSHSFQLRDAYDDAYSPPSASSAGQPSRPSTMIVKEIFGLFLREQNPPSVAAQAASAPALAPAPAPALTAAEQSDELVAPAEHEITYTSGLLQAVREMFLQFAIRAPAAAAAAAAQATTTTTTMASNDGSGQSDTSTAAAEEADAAATRPLVIPASRVESWLTALHGPAENRDQSGVHHERLAREALLRHLRRLRRQPAAADNTVPVESATSEDQQPSATAEEGAAEAADAAGTEDLIIDDGAPFASLEPAALTFSDFLELNIDELQRNPWSVMHDIQQLNVMHCLPPHAALPPSAGGLPFFERTYDYLYFTPRHFCLNAVRAPLMPEERATMEQTGVCLPNATVPSDHLPLECQLQLVTTSDTSSSSAAAADADGATAPCDLDSLTRAISERLARSSAPPSGAGGGKGQTKKNKQPKKKAPKFDAALLETLCAEADAWLRAPAAAAVAAAGAAAAGDADDDDDDDAVSGSHSHRASNLETLRQRLAAADPDASGRKFEGMLTASVVHEFLSSSPSALKATADAATGKALQKQLARRISQLIVVAPVSS